MQLVDEHIRWYQSEFEAFEKKLNGEKSTPMHTLRRDAIRRFVEIGFPTMHQEEWRFTNVSPITKIEFQSVLNYELKGVTESDIRPFLVDGTIRAVFINGMFSKELSDVSAVPIGMLVGSLAEISKKHPTIVQSHVAHFVKGEENAFTALNTAFLWDGACISVPKGFVLDRPIHILFIATNREQPFVAQPRNLIIAGTNSQLKVIETYLGLVQNTYLTNTVTEMVLGENAIVEHDKLQLESTNSYHVGTTHIKMNASSTYISNAISLGGAIVRNNINAMLEAEGIECTLNGLSLGTGTQVIDNHTAIDHARPHCNSHELYKSILDGSSKGVFNGKIFVRKDAQKTDAKQTNKTLLLSDDATINAKPQLEIFADDVKCTHGATVGQLDDEQVFYLRSRGIDLAAARNILTFAFAADVVNRMTIEPLHQQVEKLIQDRLNKNYISS